MPSSRSRRGVFLAGGLIVLAALAAYANSFGGAFVFDDGPAITDNLSLRRLATVLSPPPGAWTVSGRPVLNLSLALNYFAGGFTVGGYHAVNLLIHVLAALALFGIVRRTLLMRGGRRQPGRENPGPEAGIPPTILALAAALLWVLHPLQTESVTYIVQRAESLMGLFYLLTLYGFIRCADEAGSRRSAWGVLSVLFCLLGMGTKEVMVSAPLIVLLYDRTFVSGSLREAWRRRRNLYLGLAGTWILLGGLVIANGDHAGTAGFNVSVGAKAYWLAEFPAIGRYLRLAAWPHPLVFDYGLQWARSSRAAAPAILFVALLAAGTVVGIWRNSGLGFLGAWFFAILAPTSVVPGIRQTMAEHRMYLPLAAVLTLGVLGLGALARRIPLLRDPCLILLATLAIVFGLLTARRNALYHSNIDLWADTVASRPDNPYARASLGNALLRQYELHEWAKLNDPPASSDPWTALFEARVVQAAFAQYDAALRLKPDEPTFHYNRGCLLAEVGRKSEAVAEFREAVRLYPDYSNARNNLGAALAKAGDLPGAILQYEAALRFHPEYPAAHNNLGMALFDSGNLPRATAEFQAAVRLSPADADFHFNLGRAFDRLGRTPEAAAEYGEAVRLRPNAPQAHDNLGVALAGLGRTEEARQQFEAALRIDPGNDEARDSLDRLGPARSEK